MTLFLRLANGQDVASGFFASFTQFSRIGKYTVTTMHLCELIRDIASTPDLTRAQIMAYDSEKFEEGLARYLDAMMRNPEDAPLFEGRASLEDELDLHDEGHLLPITLSKTSAHFGDYAIEAGYFTDFSVYIARGGWLGWKHPPEYATSAKKALDESKHPIYRSLHNGKAK
ncbi:MAG TPA: hypothetical protein VJC07_04200 [Candidatus Nanoarchaeia archaeon]|nr:hypothetical protein [Candidatus Nanoarchaeia archaeon]